MKAENIFIGSFIAVVVLFLMGLFVTFPKYEPVHEHVKADHYITRFKAVPVRYCLTEDKIVAFNGEHIPIKVPVVLYPEMEALE